MTHETSSACLRAAAARARTGSEISPISWPSPMATLWWCRAGLLRACLSALTNHSPSTREAGVARAIAARSGRGEPRSEFSSSRRRAAPSHPVLSHLHLRPRARRLSASRSRRIRRGTRERHVDVAGHIPPPGGRSLLRKVQHRRRRQGDAGDERLPLDRGGRSSAARDLNRGDRR